MQIRIYKLFILLCLSVSPAFGKEPKVFLAYSSKIAASNPIYAHVITGIENKINVKKVDIDDANLSIQALLGQDKPDKIIALGKSIVDEFYKTNYKSKTIAGLMYFQNENYLGIGLTIDSQIMIQQLSKILPNFNRLFIIQQNNFQTISQSKNSQVDFRIEEDSLATIKLLGKLIEEAEPNDVIFIPANLPKNILYEVTKSAWDKKLGLISTNLGHLESGVLMVVYPDVIALSENLSEMVNKDLMTSENIKTIKFALNERVAQHLTIHFEQKTLESFSIKIK